MELIVSTKTCAIFFEITSATLSLWYKRGCPKISHGKWNLVEVFKWWQENIAELYENESGNLADIKIHYWAAKAERERFELKIKQGQFASRRQIAAEWATRVESVTSGLEMLVDRLPPLLVGKRRREIAQILSAEIFRLRDAYATKGRYCPKNK